MIRIGCHLSSSKGYQVMAKDAVKIDVNISQFSTRNPRGGNTKVTNEKDVKAFLLKAEGEDISPILTHVPYASNACPVDPRLQGFAKHTMVDDLVRMEYIPGSMYNFHLGCHVKQGVGVGVSYIVEMFNEILTSEQATIVLPEIMAGKGSEIGTALQELKQTPDLIDSSDHMGVCLDTCHVWDGGYDIASHLGEILDEFGQMIGLNRLKAIHSNDSQNSLGAHKDRHARLGGGRIGIDTFYKIVTHPILGKLPFYLETPNDLDGYRREIYMTREVADL